MFDTTRELKPKVNTEGEKSIEKPKETLVYLRLLRVLLEAYKPGDIIDLRKLKIKKNVLINLGLNSLHERSKMFNVLVNEKFLSPTTIENENENNRFYIILAEASSLADMETANLGETENRLLQAMDRILIYLQRKASKAHNGGKASHKEEIIVSYDDLFIMLGSRIYPPITQDEIDAIFAGIPGAFKITEKSYRLTNLDKFLKLSQTSSLSL